MSTSDGVLPKGQIKKGDWRKDPFEFTNAVRRAMEKAVPAAIREHHLAGDPVAISRGGQIMLLHPDGSLTPVPIASAIDGEREDG